MKQYTNVAAVYRKGLTTCCGLLLRKMATGFHVKLTRTAKILWGREKRSSRLSGPSIISPNPMKSNGSGMTKNMTHGKILRTHSGPHRSDIEWLLFQILQLSTVCMTEIYHNRDLSYVDWDSLFYRCVTSVSPSVMKYIHTPKDRKTQKTQRPKDPKTQKTQTTHKTQKT